MEMSFEAAEGCSKPPLVLKQDSGTVPDQIIREASCSQKGSLALLCTEEHVRPYQYNF